MTFDTKDPQEAVKPTASPTSVVDRMRGVGKAALVALCFLATAQAHAAPAPEPTYHLVGVSGGLQVRFYFEDSSLHAVSLYASQQVPVLR